MHSRVPQSLEYVLEQRKDGQWVVLRYRHNRKYLRVIGPYASLEAAQSELEFQRDLDVDDRRRSRTA